MTNTKKKQRIRRKMHIRKKINGTMERPRIFVFKSNKYFYAGMADDESGVVLKSIMCKKNSKDIEKMSKEFAKEIKAKKIKKAVFDRNGYKYHGLIECFVEGLRSDGINI
jgi:large subunit ribosomal protein L18